MREEILIYIDGGCSNNGQEDAEMGIGVVIDYAEEKDNEVISLYGGIGTNNIAEYSALLKALEIVYERAYIKAKIMSDSNLVVSQVNGKWRCKDNKLIPLYLKSIKRIDYLRSKGYLLNIEWIPREENLADKPAKDGYKKRS